MRDFLPSLAICLCPKPLKGRGHVPSANLQDFRPPNERASVCGRSSEDSGQTADHRLILSYWFTGSPANQEGWRIRAFGSYGLRKNERRSAPPLAPKAQEAAMFPPEQASSVAFSRRNRQKKILPFAEFDSAHREFQCSSRSRDYSTLHSRGRPFRFYTKATHAKADRFQDSIHFAACAAGACIDRLPLSSRS